VVVAVRTLAVSKAYLCRTFIARGVSSIETTFGLLTENPELRCEGAPRFSDRRRADAPIVPPPEEGRELLIVSASRFKTKISLSN